MRKFSIHKNSLSYICWPQKHHAAEPPPPTRWQKNLFNFSSNSHVSAASCLQGPWSVKLIAAKSSSGFVSQVLCLTHSCPLSSSNWQSSFTRATTLSSSIPTASRAPLSHVYNEDASNILGKYCDMHAHNIRCPLKSVTIDPSSLQRPRTFPLQNFLSIIESLGCVILHTCYALLPFCGQIFCG